MSMHKINRIAIFIGGIGHHGSHYAAYKAQALYGHYLSAFGTLLISYLY